MMLEGHYVEVVFENVQSIIIPMSRFSKLFVGSQIRNKESRNDVERFETEYLKMVIPYTSKEELVVKEENEDNLMCISSVPNEDKNIDNFPDLLGRITQYGDIVSLYLLDEKMNPFRVIVVPWDGRDNNDLMSIKTTDKDIHIEIKGF